jgi:predicted nucleotidyltransferase
MLGTPIEHLVHKLKAFFSCNAEVHFVYLFGSTVTGTQNRFSDVDIAVYLDNLALKPRAYPYGYKAYLIAELMQLLKTNRIDVVILNEATPFLKYQVIRYGFPVYEISTQERIQFHVGALSRYFDLLPILDVHLNRPLFREAP